MIINTLKSQRGLEAKQAAKAGQAKRPAPGTSKRADFCTVLKNQTTADANVQTQENNSSRPVQCSRTVPGVRTQVGRNIDTGFAVNPSRNGGVSPLDAAVTATLLRLNALKISRPGAALPFSSEGLARPMAPLARMGALRGTSPAGAALRATEGLGSLSARFESGEAGVDAIGYDRQGGTSYGQYQISSRAGTMRDFLAFLEERAPEWARHLKAASPTNTGGRGGAMPREWKRIAAENPDRFAALQRDFIERTHYLPALEEIRERTGVDIKSQPRALQEVLWSTAVQHGARGAARLFCRAMEQGGASPRQSPLPTRKVIVEIYSERAGQFGSSRAQVRAAVRRRFQEERKLALGMLNDGVRGSRATV